MINPDLMLSQEEIGILVNLSATSEAQWEVLIASTDEDFCGEIQNLFRDDNLVRVGCVKGGCEALVALARRSPNLFVFDRSLPDVDGAGFVRTLRNDGELRSMRIVCRLDSASDALPDWGCDEYVISGDDVDAIYLSRKMHALLYTTEAGSRVGSKRERRWPRTTLTATVQISIPDPADSGSIHVGEAVVENISLGGAFLSGIKLDSGELPSGEMNVTLRIDHEALKQWSADSRIVYRDNGVAAGVKFVNISREDRLKIVDLFPS